MAPSLNIDRQHCHSLWVWTR